MSSSALLLLSSATGSTAPHGTFMAHLLVPCPTSTLVRRRTARATTRFRDPQGRQRKKTFRTKKEAEHFAATVQTDRWAGRWVDPASGKATLAEYAQLWLETRPRPLRPRTAELYEGLLRLHILPDLGQRQLARISPADVRTWHATLVRSCGPSSVVPAKRYRLLRAILATRRMTNRSHGTRASSNGLASNMPPSDQ